VWYSQNGDDPQEHFSQIWLQAKYENKLFFKKKFLLFLLATPTLNHV
jgi:hypothetical protein